MKYKQTLDFVLELVRIFKPDHRKWMVRIFVISGIPLLSSSFIQTLVEAALRKEFDLDLGSTSVPGWILIAIGVGIYFFNSYQEKQARKEPTFREEHERLNFSLGGGITCGYTKEQLKKGPNSPFNFGGHLPIQVYVEGDKLYTDVEVFGKSGLPPIKITKNVLSGLPHNWDSNKNENALEVVDENGVPIYQLIYKQDGHILVNGIFPFPGGLVLADDKQMVMNPSLPAMLELKKIFKYPSWKYPAVYET
jgi:hypothetical protein